MTFESTVDAVALKTQMLLKEVKTGFPENLKMDLIHYTNDAYAWLGTHYYLALTTVGLVITTVLAGVFFWKWRTAKRSSDEYLELYLSTLEQSMGRNVTIADLDDEIGRLKAKIAANDNVFSVAA